MADMERGKKDKTGWGFLVAGEMALAVERMANPRQVPSSCDKISRNLFTYAIVLHMFSVFSLFYFPSFFPTLFGWELCCCICIGRGMLEHLLVFLWCSSVMA
jgi:hypothetical protein